MHNYGTVPDEMKVSKMKPLFKKGDVTLLNNYRPRSILPCLSKIFERVLFNQLYEYFERNNILTQRQYRFRKNHSTEFAAMELIDRVTKILELGKIPFNLYIDLSKAFDVCFFISLLLSSCNILIVIIHHIFG